MSLKSIRTSYSKFLNVLTAAGVTLTEAQKADIDSFILAIEAKMQDQKKMAVKATKKIVTEHLEKQFKTVFESIMKHRAQNEMLSGKIQKLVTQIKESKKVARQVDNYLNLYVESVLPKQTILDYDRMQKLEALHESLKELLVVNETTVVDKKKELKESFDRKESDYKTQIAKLQVKLNESMKKTLKLNKKIDQFKAIELLESKTADLPLYEAARLKKKFANATTVEIEKNFKRVLEGIQNDVAAQTDVEETSIEEEVKDIISEEDEEKPTKVKKECDVLRNRPHNLHLGEAEDDEEEKEEAVDEDEIPMFDPSQVCEFERNNVNESTIINSDLMKLWSAQANSY